MSQFEDIITSADKFHIKLGLDRIKGILALINNPQDKIKFIHVAGTNGKGSTCAVLNQILVENELKTGLYTSPHLFRYNERIKINNEEIKTSDLDEIVIFIEEIAKKNNINLTEFEILTAAAFYYFEKEKVDVAILETGLGGRFDATNVIKNPLVTIITDIDMEHTERLGDTIEKISFEKAGIIKGKCPLVVGKNNKGLDVFKDIAQNIYITDDIDLPLGFSLVGSHQKRNLALAMKALEFLPFKLDKDKTKNALSNIKWRFRIEFNREKMTIIDGCHNPAGVKELRKYLDENFKDVKKQFIFGCLRNKNYNEMLDILLKSDDELLFNEFKHKDSLKFNELPLEYKNKAKKYDESLLDKNKLRIFCGSLYMLGEMFKGS